MFTSSPVYILTIGFEAYVIDYNFAHLIRKVIHICMYIHMSLSGPVEKKRSRRRKLLYPHPKLSLGLVPYRPLL